MASSATRPTLVSWNGSGFDLPVLNYRALRHGVRAHRYWEVGETDREFRYNNYLSRFHWRHIDLMDVLSGYGASGRGSLDTVAQLLGLPGKLGIGGAHVWSSFQRGELAAIRDYCETDVLNTYLIYLRFQLIRGELEPARLSRRAPASRGEARAVGPAAPEAVPRHLATDPACGVTAPIVTTTIVDLTHDGEGVADLDGKRVFVPDALPGERVEIRLRKRRRKLQEADLVRVLEPSPSRVTPECEYFGRCGGCALQHLAHPAQVHFKQEAVAQTLARIARAEPEEWLPAVVGPPWRYRRRARLGVKYVAGKGRVLVGFRERAGPYITDMRHCPVLAPPLGELLGELADLIERHEHPRTVAADRSGRGRRRERARAARASRRRAPPTSRCSASSANVTVSTSTCSPAAPGPWHPSTRPAR